MVMLQLNEPHHEKTNNVVWIEAGNFGFMYYPCSEDKGAGQLRSYCEADLHLCFRICRLLFFS